MTHSSRSLLIAACLTIASMGASHSAIAQAAKNSCVGEEACVGNTGTAAEDACNGRRACFGNWGKIAMHACNGALACNNNSADVAQHACNGYDA